MNITQIETAIREAQRFIAKAEEAKTRIKVDFTEAQRSFGMTNLPCYTITSKETAACKRASMDLSRTLVELRR